MNKKYIVGGIIFWAGLSGYMGLRILESYTEDAVFAALSAVPAQAQEIRYSFLTNTLTLKGVEYELPDDTIMHKGSIERVDVTGFNRKCMFVKPDMPAYDPDTLPVVAESISASGITDRIHVGNVQAEQHISDVHIRGWYQRLGMFLDQHRQHNGEVSYYEELFRTRLDGMEVNNLTLTLTGPDMPPATVSVDKIALSEGLHLVHERISGRACKVVHVHLDEPYPVPVKKILEMHTMRAGMNRIHDRHVAGLGIHAEPVYFLHACGNARCGHDVFRGSSLRPRRRPDGGQAFSAVGRSEAGGQCKTDKKGSDKGCSVHFCSSLMVAGTRLSSVRAAP